MKKRRKRKSNKKILIFGSIIIICILTITTVLMLTNKPLLNKKDNILPDIINHYNKTVITNKVSKIYIKNNDEYKEIGTIEDSVILTLKDEEITENTRYFIVSNMDEEYYIKYNDVEKSESEYQKIERYKRYIPFNENIYGNNIKLYRDDKLIYTLNKEVSLPIYIKDNDTYYVEYANELFKVKKEEVEIVTNNNTSEKNTKGVGVLNYHFFWDDQTEKRSECNQEICHSTTQFKEHLDYIKNNNIFTPTMSELEMYIDGKIQLPRSVVITIDDGWRADIGIKILNEYELNATLFLITGDYNPDDFKSEYVELHSHTDRLHAAGKCPGGQGGGIKCLPKDEILNDLKTSREKLNNSTVLCYPFYEYNSYSIEVAKEAGFTMAFRGESYNSDNLVKVGSDKFRLPRFVVVTYTTMSDFTKYIG